MRVQTRNITIITIFASVCVVLGGSVFVPFILPRYTAAIPYFLILSLQGIGQCFYFLYCNYLFYYSKNKLIMYVTFSCAALHLGLSLLFTRFSLYLTCVVYVLTQALVTLLVYGMSRRVIKDYIE